MQTLTVPATLDSLALISEFITNATARAGLDEHAAWQVQLAVDEAATNVIQHGYDPTTPGDIELSWRVEGGEFVVMLRDRGRSFNPETVPEPDITCSIEERQAGGLGLFLMKRLMDEVQFTFDPQQGNLLTMTKRIAKEATQPRIVEIEGRLDAVTTPAAIARIEAEIEAGARQVLLDMAGVIFLSSTALRSLLLVRRRLLSQEGELRLCRLRPQVEEVFVITGFNQLFAIHLTREEALAAFGQGQA